jgi:hypothetical protein
MYSFFMSAFVGWWCRGQLIRLALAVQVWRLDTRCRLRQKIAWPVSIQLTTHYLLQADRYRSVQFTIG